MKRKRTAYRLQYAALPYRRTTDGSLQVMLVTSKRSRRWIIPKGWPVAGLRPAQSAAREAEEEAGLVGRISERPIGAYSYDKRTAGGTSMRCRVRTFALEVEAQLSAWPEQDRRRTRWFALPEAARAVQEPELKAMIANLPTLLDA